MAQVEEWYSLDDIAPSEDSSRLYCISVDSPDKQFLAGKTAFPTHNTEEGKEDDAKKGEAQLIISSIARLGRAAGVHLVVATQRPDASLLPGETKANLAVRINAGRTDSNASSMILGSAEGTRVKANPKGRLYLGFAGGGTGDHGQGFFAPQSWIDDYLKEKGLNPDGTPIDGSSVPVEDSTDGSADDAFTPDVPTDERARDTGKVDREVGGVRLTMAGSEGSEDKYRRPEDDWDDTMDFIATNYDDEDDED